MVVGGILSDREILALGEQIVTPFDNSRVQPCSYDLSLHGKALKHAIPIPSAPRFVDLRVSGPKMLPIEIGNGYVLERGECLLCSTEEQIICPPNLAARVEGKSSLGRLFLSIHISAGFIDAGWKGRVTLELVNHGPWPVVIWTGQRIAQVSFMALSSPCLRPYGSAGLGSHYGADNMGPVAAKKA